MSDPDDDGATSRRLAQIASILGVPAGAFFGPMDAETLCARELEERELIDLFRALPDPHQRRRCLDLVRALIDRSDGD